MSRKKDRLDQLISAESRDRAENRERFIAEFEENLYRLIISDPISSSGLSGRVGMSLEFEKRLESHPGTVTLAEVADIFFVLGKSPHVIYDDDPGFRIMEEAD